MCTGLDCPRLPCHITISPAPTSFRYGRKQSERWLPTVDVSYRSAIRLRTPRFWLSGYEAVIALTLRACLTSAQDNASRSPHMRSSIGSAKAVRVALQSMNPTAVLTRSSIWCRLPGSKPSKLSSCRFETSTDIRGRAAEWRPNHRVARNLDSTISEA